jgi:hypothetical protein
MARQSFNTWVANGGNEDAVRVIWREYCSKVMVEKSDIVPGRFGEKEKVITLVVGHPKSVEND